jgi:transposase
MGRVNTPILKESERKALELGFQTSTSHAFRKRCQVILLKADGRNSEDVGLITKMSAVSVNTWLKRYKTEGIEGLKTKSGRGRKRKINKETDKDVIVAIVKKNRQRLETAKAEWEKESGKSVSIGTFKTFAEDINV